MDSQSLFPDRFVLPLRMEINDGAVGAGIVLPLYHCSIRSLCPPHELLCRRGREGGNGRKVYGSSKDKTCKAGLSASPTSIIIKAYGVGSTLPHGIEGKAFRERKSSTCPIIHWVAARSLAQPMKAQPSRSRLPVFPLTSTGAPFTYCLVSTGTEPEPAPFLS